MTNTAGLYDKFGPYTMIPPDRFEQNVTMIKNYINKNTMPKGEIVEFGVWNGGMALTLMALFGQDRTYKFFDSFEGLPPITEKDGEDAKFWSEHPEHPRYFNGCKADYDIVKNRLTMQDYDVSVIKGWFSDTLNKYLGSSIAFVHIDSDWYESVYACLDAVWSKVSVGGIILIDDYYDWEGCRRAVHDFLAHMNAREAIEFVGDSSGIMIKRRGDWAIEESPHLW